MSSFAHLNQLGWKFVTFTLIASSMGVVDIVDICRTRPNTALRSIDMTNGCTRYQMLRKSYLYRWRLEY